MRWRMILSGLAVITLAGIAVSTLSAQATLEDQQSRLSNARAQSQAAAERSASLERAASRARNAAEAASAREAAIAARIQGAEADIAAAQARIAIVDRLLRTQQSRLADQRGPITRLVAALQSLARRPVPLSIVQPGSTADIVHVRAVLGTVVPVVEQRTAAVRAELERTRKLHTESNRAVASLRDSRGRFEAERLDLTRLEASNRLRSRELGRSALIESDRAIALGEQARDIVDLMDQLGDAATVRASLESLPGPLPRPPQPGEATLPEAAAAPPPHQAQPYRLPLAGRVVRGFGDVSDAGVRSRGITLAPAANAQAVAPAEGRVLFAGPFRDYGQILILDHGGGWTSLITGLGSVSVKVGDRLVQGSPVGRSAASDDHNVTLELRRKGQPVDLVPLLG